MSGSVNRPHSVSPPARPQAWEPPTSPNAPTSNARKSALTVSENDITVKQILDRYSDDPELLKHVLMAKAEEDKKRTAIDTLSVEQARIHLRELDIELLREHIKYTAATSSHDKPTLHPIFPPPPSVSASAATTTTTTTTTTAAPIPASHPTSGVDHRQNPHDSFYGLAPVQQQVLARITGGEFTESHSGYYPRSPVTYPHSAHPLCPPSSESSQPFRSAFSVNNSNKNGNNNNNNNNNNRIFPRNNNNSSYQHQPTTPISPGVAIAAASAAAAAAATTAQPDRDDPHSLRKRGHGSVGGSYEDMTHDQVMEALKAKIKRGNHDRSKRVRMPSPRSAKPILPPIDTSVGRMRSIPPPVASSPVAMPHGDLPPPPPPPRPTAAASDSSSASTAETAS